MFYYFMYTVIKKKKKKVIAVEIANNYLKAYSEYFNM